MDCGFFVYTNAKTIAKIAAGVDIFFGFGAIIFSVTMHSFLWATAIALIFPDIMSIVVGFCILSAVTENCGTIARRALVLNMLLILGSILTVIIFFSTGHYWLEVLPVLFWALLQIFLLFVIQLQFRLLGLTRNTDIETDRIVVTM